jgi:flagellin
MSVINTNNNALFAQNSIYQVNKAQSNAMQQLSTGQRINSAKDDAAGLAIATRMTSDINGYAVAVQNSNQGMNMAQTADGALNNVNNILQTMRQLAVEASNGTMTSANRKSTQAEVAQLQKQIDSIAHTTASNGIQLLDGTAGNVILQTGVNQGNTMTMSIGSVQTKDIGIGSLASLTSIQANSTPAALSTGDLLINGVSVPASVATSDTSSSNLNEASSIAKAAAINSVSKNTGVTATVDPTSVGGTSMTAAALTGSLTINGVSTASFSTTTDTTISRQLTIQAINNISKETGVTASDSQTATGGVILSAADGRNIQVAFTTLTAASTGVTAAGTYGGQIELHSTTASPIEIGTTPSGTITNSGFTVGSYQPNQATVVTNLQTQAATAPTSTFDATTMSINGVAIGATLAQDDTASYIDATNAVSSVSTNSSIAIAAAINRQTKLTGVSAVAAPNVITGSTFTASALGAAGLKINGVTIAAAATLGASNTLVDSMNAINQYSGQTGVTAVDNGNGLTLTAQDGRNIVIEATTAATAATQLGIPAAAIGAATAPVTTYGKVQLVSDNKFTVAAGSSGTSTLENLGFNVGTYGGANNGLKINQIDVSSQSGAQSAITAIDAAISTVSAIQSNVGAYENRLSSTVTNLQSMNTNMSSSRSTIQDTNYSTTTTALARSQIISQAATAMLAQANQSGQTVLSLLK